MNKNMIRLLIGQFITIFGTQIYTFALSYYILRETGSGLLFGGSLAMGMLPQLLISPVAGVISDKFSRKNIIVMTDLISGCILFITFILSCFSGFLIAYIYILMFSLSVLSIFNAIALQSALPNVVEQNKLPQLNSLSQSVASSARITAPIAGGVLILNMDIRLFLLINAISFFSASILEYRIVFFEKEKVKEETLRISHSIKVFIEDMKESIVYCKNNRVIFLILFFMIFMNFLFQFGFTVPIPYIVNNTLQMTSNQYGAIQGMTSFGALLTSLILVKKLNLKNSKSLLVKATFCMAGVLIAMGITTIVGIQNPGKTIIFLMFAFLNFVFGGTIVTSNIPMSTLLQSTSEDSYRGRVVGISNTMSSLITPLAVILSGAMLDFLPDRPYMLCFAGGGFLILLIVILSKKKEMK